MPNLDVSEIINDPDFADTVTVTRRAEDVDEASGLSVITSTVFPGVVGVVTMASPDDLVRLEVSQMTARCISFITQFRLRGSAQGFQPDVITWDGTDYTVIALDPYHRFGTGFVECFALSMNASSAPVT